MSQGAATDTVAFVDAVRARQRAARHTASLVLGVHAVALAWLTVVRVVRLHGGAFFDVSQWLVPVAVYLVLWVVVRLRALRTGIGAAREGFGVAAVLALALVVGPFSLFLSVMVGAGAILGAGLVVLGVRLRIRPLWVSGLVLMALSPLVQLDVVDNHAAFLGPRPGAVVLGLLAIGLVVLAAASARAERATLRRPPP